MKRKQIGVSGAFAVAETRCQRFGRIVHLSTLPSTAQYSILHNLDIHKLLDDIFSSVLLFFGQSQSAFPTPDVNFTICSTGRHDVRFRQKALDLMHEPPSKQPATKPMQMVIACAQLLSISQGFSPKRMSRPTPLWRLAASNRECPPPWPGPVPCPKSAQERC